MVLAVVAFFDGLTGDGYALGLSYALAPFVAAAFGGTRSTPLLGLGAVVLGFASGPWTADLTGQNRLIHIGVIGIASLIAIPMARARSREILSARRFRVLNDIAEVAGQAPRLNVALEAIGDVVVPEIADFYVVDVFSRGRIERVGARFHGENAEEMRRRVMSRVPSVPPELLEEDGQHPRPVLVEAVTDSHLNELAHDPADRQMLQDLGMRSYIKLPLIARGRSLGALSLALTGSGRRYDLGDLEFTKVLSGRIALALDNAGLFSDLRELELRTETVMSSLDEGVLIHNGAGELVYANDAAARVFDFDDAEALMAGAGEIPSRTSFYDEAGMPSNFAQEALERALAGESLAPEIIRVAYGSERSELWMRVKVRTVLNQGSQPLVVTVLEDLTEIKREELAQTLLSSMGGLLSFSNDFREVLERLAQVGVPEFADYCEIAMARTYRTSNFMAFAHRDASRRSPLGPPSGKASSISAELKVGETVLGTMSFVNEEGRRRFDEFDRTLAERLAERAAVVLENVRLAGARAEIADSLQHGLMPPPLPHIPEWTVAALYRPAGEENQVGGDFYEVFAIDGGWMVAIGDVTGKGAHAASVTAQARYTLRTAGSLNSDPVQTLATLNRALLARGDGSMCSVALLMLKDGDDRVQTAVAGHPLPLLVGRGRAEPIGVTGPVLGAFPNGSWTLGINSVAPEDRIFLYTDGVTETPGEHERFGEKRLRDCLLDAGCPVTSIDKVERMVNEFAGGALEDDIAVVSLTREAEWPAEGVIVLTDAERERLRVA